MKLPTDRRFDPLSTATRESPIPEGLYLLCDDGAGPDLPLVDKASLLLEGGARILQVRIKRARGAAALEAVRAVAARCRAAKALCIVNDRVDWALLSGADGVHLGDEDLPPSAARELLGPSAIIGVTCRDPPSIRAALEARASYVGVGPVFPTRSKQVNAALLGLERLEAIAKDSPLPVVAISGIGLTRIASVARTGVHGAAVLSDPWEAASVPERVRALTAAFASGRSERSLARRT